MKKGKFQNKGSKIVALMLAMMLVFGVAVGGTLAYLMAEADEVVNTFTVGDINIDLAETKGNTFKILPGAKADKDPTVTVESGSEKCYVYVQIDNTVRLDGTVVATPNINTTDWIQVAANGTKTLYRYKAVVDASSADVPLAVFTEVTYSEDIEKGDINTLKDTTIKIDAFAHQSEHTDQTTADKAAKDHFTGYGA